MSDGRLRVLFIAPVEPWGRENGSSLITADLLEALARRDDVDLLSVHLRESPRAATLQVPPELRQIRMGLECLPKWGSVLVAAAHGHIPLRHRFANGRVAHTVARAVEQAGFRPDVIHIEHLPLVDIGERLGRFFDAPVVYRAHNIESLLWGRRLPLPGFAGHALHRRMERSEANAMRRVRRTLCISEVDLAWARRRAPDADAALLPCSLLVDRYRSVRHSVEPNEPVVCFVGGLEWTPNEVGLRWFVETVLPRVLRVMPEARLAVLARGARERPWLTGHPAVRILPPESDAAAVFAGSRVSIAPLFQGGGVRIKIPESLALGCPVVGTAIGAEGHALEELTITDDADRFAEACLAHLRAPLAREARDRLAAAVDAEYGAQRVADRLVATWSSVVPDGRPLDGSPFPAGHAGPSAGVDVLSEDPRSPNRAQYTRSRP